MAPVERKDIRRLAELRVDDGAVLSVYLNLDPSEFGTAPARATAIRSVIDAASREARELVGDLPHDAGVALHDDVKRVEEFLGSADFTGARGLAVFASGPAGLFETLKLPRPVEQAAVVDDSPFVEPLVAMVPGGEWCVLLANRRDARLLRGTAEQLVEVARFSDNVHGQHDQGGWSQARYQRSVDNEAVHHLKRAADAAHRSYRRRRFDHLLLGAPDETFAALEKEVHAELQSRLRGRVEVDVSNSNVDQILEAAAPVIERHDRERQDDFLAQLQEGLGRGERAAAGLGDVLAALNEQRVGALLLEEGFAAPGVECPKCGWLGPAEGGEECPADGTELLRRDDIGEPAVERAVTQDAEVVVLRDRPDLGPHGGIAAVLRF